MEKNEILDINKLIKQYYVNHKTKLVKYKIMGNMIYVEDDKGKPAIYQITGSQLRLFVLKDTYEDSNYVKFKSILRELKLNNLIDE